ncbi:MAG: FAD:protein FMN transferase [Pirellulales bacterium]|nr:FAD:protein FMN transferase [Pirellulales bacterium]
MPDDKPSSRRDFLRGRSAGRALVEAARALADQALPPLERLAPTVGPSRPTLHRPSAVAHLYASRRAMACEFAVQYHAEDGAEASDAALAALDLIDQLEDQLSIYRPHTEASTINRTAADQAVEVEPRLFVLLELCAWLHAATGGAFDITTGPLSRVWGFLKREGRLPSDDEIAAALERVGFHHVELDRDRHTIRFLKPGVEINFNSIGKGYALDRAAELFAARGVDDYLCHGGRSSVLARGRDRAGDCRGWAIAVPHPHQLQRSVGEIILRDQALGTSGAGTQFFIADGRRYGHLLDPRTGRPTDGVFTATAVADTAAEADALATAFYILGPAGASEYCAAHPEAGAVLVCQREGELNAFDVHTFNLNDGRWLPAQE